MADQISTLAAARAQSQSGIYEIVNLVNGKRYVGSAVDLAQRWREHRWGLKGRRHGNRHLQASWEKYGEAAFSFVVIELCEPAALIEREQAAIDRLQPEYNICPTAGSTLGRPHTAEARAKIAAKKAGLKLPPRTDEYRAKIGAAHRGKPKSPEHMAALQAGRLRQTFDEDRRQRVSESLKAAYAEGRKPRGRSPEYRQKIAETLRKRALHPEFRERMRKQAADAWAAKTDQERRARTEMMRAARSVRAASSE